MSGEFAVVWLHRDMLIAGFANTIWLCTVAAAASLLCGAMLSFALMARSRLVARAAGVLVDVMRCVPFLLFAYLIYYGLPSLGLRFSSFGSGLVALIVYNAAYMAELLRAAWVGLPRETIEAGHAFGFHGFGLFRRIILPPVLLAAAPMIGNQVIQIVKDSAFLTIITVSELTHAAAAIQSQYYVPFASFITAVLLYWVLCFAIERGVGRFGALDAARR